MSQGTANTENLTTEQLKFQIKVMGMIMDKLIQDSMDLDEDGTPVLADKQSDPAIRQAMILLNYK